MAYVTTWDGLSAGRSAAWEVIGDLEPALVNPPPPTRLACSWTPTSTPIWPGRLSKGSLCDITGETSANFAQVLTADGTTGWMDNRYLSPLPHAFVSAQVGRQSDPALYAQPQFGADLVATLEAGATLTVLDRPDEFWLEVYSPAHGIAYGMANQFSPVYTTAEVQVDGAIVREGPSSEQFNAIAQVSAGTEVVVVGTNEDGDWVKVLLPFEEIDSPFRGVEGWIATFLFQDANGETSLNLDILSVVE